MRKYQVFLALAVLFVSVFLTSYEICYAQQINLNKKYNKLVDTGVLIKSDYMYRDPNTKQEIYTAHTGSGFFIREDGLILTTDHMGWDSYVEKTRYSPLYGKLATLYGVTVFYNNVSYKAKIVAVALDGYLAFLKIKDSNDQKFPVASIERKKHLKIGDPIFSIANPQPFRNILKVGIVSGLINYDDSGAYTTAQFLNSNNLDLEHGDSGGAIFNKHGKVVGVNNYFHIGSAAVLLDEFTINIIDHVLSNRVFERSIFKLDDYTGHFEDYSVFEQQVNLAQQATTRSGYHIPPGLKQGILVVNPTEPGFKNSDIIISFDDKPVVNIVNFLRMVAHSPPGKSVKFELYRGGQLITFDTALSTEKIVPNY